MFYFETNYNSSMKRYLLLVYKTSSLANKKYSKTLVSMNDSSVENAMKRARMGEPGIAKIELIKIR